MYGYALFPCIQVIPWFHSVKFKEGRTSRQTELQCEFPLHVVCSWSGNSPRIAQQRNLVVTEDDFATAAGDLLNLCNENADHPLIVTNFFNFKSHLTRRLDPTSFATHNSGGNYFSEICSRISDSASDHQPRGRDTSIPSDRALVLEVIVPGTGAHPTGSGPDRELSHIDTGGGHEIAAAVLEVK